MNLSIIADSESDAFLRNQRERKREQSHDIQRGLK